MERRRQQESSSTDQLSLGGTVTGIGSLPLTDPAGAVDCVAAHCPDIPFWPQLPRRSGHEAIIAQPIGVLAGLIERRPNGFGYQVRSNQLGRRGGTLSRQFRSTRYIPRRRVYGLRFRARRRTLSQRQSDQGTDRGTDFFSVLSLLRRPSFRGRSISFLRGVFACRQDCSMADRSIEPNGAPRIVFC